MGILCEFRELNACDIKHELRVKGGGKLLVDCILGNEMSNSNCPLKYISNIENNASRDLAIKGITSTDHFVYDS